MQHADDKRPVDATIRVDRPLCSQTPDYLHPRSSQSISVDPLYRQAATCTYRVV
jgi:hypothetical protein